MNLKKAIEQQQDLELCGDIGLDQDEIDALHLGIEAMKLVEMERRDHLSYAGELLPGETED